MTYWNEDSSTLLTPTESLARDFAMKMHGDQKYGDEPYVTHLDAVRYVAVDFELSEEIRVACFLHDVIEDVFGSTEEQVLDVIVDMGTGKLDPERGDLYRMASLFGSDVLGIVECVTGRGKNRKERVVDAYRKIFAASVTTLGPAPAFVKLCDRIANVESARRRADDSFLRLYVAGLYVAEWGGFRETMAAVFENDPTDGDFCARCDGVGRVSLPGPLLAPGVVAAVHRQATRKACKGRGKAKKKWRRMMNRLARALGQKENQT